MSHPGARLSCLALILTGLLGAGPASALTQAEIDHLWSLTRSDEDSYASQRVKKALEVLDSKRLLRPLEGSLISIAVRSGDPEAIAQVDELVAWRALPGATGEREDIADPAWLDQVEREIQAVEAAMEKYLGDGSTESILQRLKLDWIGYDGSFFSISRVLTLDGLRNYEPMGFTQFLHQARRRNRLVYDRYLVYVEPFAWKFENFRKTFVISAEKHRREAAEELHENHGRLSGAIRAARALVASDRRAAAPAPLRPPLGATDGSPE